MLYFTSKFYDVCMMYIDSFSNYIYVNIQFLAVNNTITSKK